MLGLTVELHPAAIDEANGAFLWYAERSPDAANTFIAELDKAILAVSESPERWPEYVAGTRRYLFRRFPFYLVYTLESGMVRVLAVAHAKRKPGYWKDRR